MKEILKDLNKAFENKTRLGIMSALVVNERLDFNSLKELLGVTDGNLASHLKSLEKLSYVSVRKEFLDRKPNTSYEATSEGTRAFKRHLSAIEKLLE
ncbi:winged helix-turn-helix domain-containing protein [Ekhidna sp.]|uniref:winged helix-turn-helix domain-containing protein n=1 Tax=Ekhidna sp. TaxID=2608089 RepID=UPI003B509842